MDFLRPATLDEALAARSEHPDGVPIMGGTDLMVELNFDQRRPETLIDLTSVSALCEWRRDGDMLRIGAGVSYTRIIEELECAAPALVQASRTVASPQIRNRGTIGGNLGSASPAGECHVPLLATDATVELASVHGTRRVAARDFYLGPRSTACRPDELVTAVILPRRSGPQHFCKIGTRNAMVIAVASFCLVLNPYDRTVGTGLGSAGPTPLRADEAEEFLAAEFDWDDASPPSESVAHRFGDLVAAVARPMDDQRGTASYRRHAVAVMARRALGWSAAEYRATLQDSEGETRCA